MYLSVDELICQLLESNCVDNYIDLLEARRITLDEEGWIALIAHYLDLWEIHGRKATPKRIRPIAQVKRYEGSSINKRNKPISVWDPETGEPTAEGFALWRGIDPEQFMKMFDKYKARAERYRRTQKHKDVLRRAMQYDLPVLLGTLKPKASYRSPTKTFEHVKIVADFLAAKEADPKLKQSDYASEVGLSQAFLSRLIRTYRTEAAAYVHLKGAGEPIPQPTTEKPRGISRNYIQPERRGNVQIHAVPEPEIRTDYDLTPQERHELEHRKPQKHLEPDDAVAKFNALFNKPGVTGPPSEPDVPPQPTTAELDAEIGAREAASIRRSPSELKDWKKLADDYNKIGQFHKEFMEKWMEIVYPVSVPMTLKERVFPRKVTRILKALGLWNPTTQHLSDQEIYDILWADAELDTLNDMVAGETGTYYGRIKGPSEKKTARTYRRKFVEYALDFGISKERISKYLRRAANYLNSLLADPTLDEPHEAPQPVAASQPAPLPGAAIDEWPYDERLPRVYILGVLSNAAVPTWLKDKYETNIVRGGRENLKRKHFRLDAISRNFNGSNPDVVIVVPRGMAAVQKNNPEWITNLVNDANSSGIPILGLSASRTTTAVSGIIQSEGDVVPWLKEALERFENLGTLYEMLKPIGLEMLVA